MRVCDVSREKAVWYLELEDIEHDFDDAVREDLRVRRIQFAQLELACDREAMIAARDALVQYRLRWVRYRHEARGGLIPGDIVHDTINLMIRHAGESIAAATVAVTGLDVLPPLAEQVCSRKIPASSSDPGSDQR